MSSLTKTIEEKCGLAAAINIPMASVLVSQMLQVMQHRGEAGAKMIINVYLSPMIKQTCYLGMDHQTTDELIAHGRNEEQISKQTGADKTIYLSLNGLNKIVEQTYKAKICTGCFGGKYPIIK